MKVLLIFAAVLSSIVSLQAAAPSATASSNETGKLTPNLAIDGNRATRWASKAADNQTFTVDFGAVKDVKSIGIVWETAYGKEYDIQLQDAKGVFKTVASVKNAKTGLATVDLKTPEKAKGMKLILKKRGTQYGFSIFEILINGASLQQPAKK